MFHVGQQASKFYVFAGDYRLTSLGVDAIITDPPYGNYFGNQRKKIKEAVVEGDDMTWVGGFGDFVHRVCPRGPVVLFCDRKKRSFIEQSLVSQGLNFINDAVWVKKPWGIGYNFRPAHEHILLFSTASTIKASHSSLSSVLVHSKVSASKKVHPTEKPVPLMEDLVRGFSLPGQVILDPFMGSGATGVAALKRGRLFVGSDLNPDYVELAHSRLSAG